MTNRSLLPPAVRAWGKTIAVLGGSLAAYVAVALLVTILTGDAIAGAAVSNLVALALALGYRWRSTGRLRATAPRPRARTGGFWLAAVAALAVCWVAGQATAIWIYDVFGSEGFDAVNAARQDSPTWLLLITALVLAPIGEESLIRGIAYPALRRHWPPLASAFVTASVFAILHGNLVQIALTVPLGILLAFVYEAAQRLWPVVLMHMLFNLASTVVPPQAVQLMAQPVMIVFLLLATALLLFALTPRRYTVEKRVDDSTRVAR